jgi:extracellular factor (EF) 3-hydroxypalmitic acid methyl ester biosynthesis protein
MADETAALSRYLDDAYDDIRRGKVAETVEALIAHLRKALESSADLSWRSTMNALCRTHPVLQVLHEDPYTWRAFHKPRGYAGDAVLLDFIYTGRPPPETSELGKQIFEVTTTCSASRSVQERKDVIANAIDVIASRRPDVRVLSLACGHLREAELSDAVCAGAVSEYLALDQDEQSLAVVEREHAGRGIRTLHTSIRKLLRGDEIAATLSHLDFVYAAGLFDYLPDGIASRLIARMFAMLRPGGSLLIANYVPATHERGYMDAIMDWELIYRDREDLERIASVIDLGRTADRRSYLDGNGNVAYLELTAA